MSTIKQYRNQIEGVMKHKVPAFKKGNAVYPWQLIDSRETVHSFDYRYEVPSGYGLIDLEKQIDALFAATGCIVELKDRAGCIDISVFTHDFPISIPFSVVEPLLRNGKVLLGLNRRMEPIYHSFKVNPHLLIGGMPGYGKTDLLRFIMYQMLKMTYEIRVVDMKGFSFMPFAKIPGFRIARNLDTAMELLADTVEILLDREEQVYNHPNHRELIKTFKPICIIVDEAAQISPAFNNGDRRNPDSAKVKAIQCVEYCSKIATKGRETRVSIIYCTQRPDSEVVNGQIKGTLESSICFRTKTATNSEIILDRTGAEKLPEHVPGRSIYSGMNDVIMQVPFVGKDAAWEKLLAPFYWEGAENGGSHRKLPDKKPAETNDYADFEDITPVQDGAHSAAPSGATGESTKTGFRNVAGIGAKRRFNRESGPQGNLGRNEDLPFEQNWTDANGSDEATDTHEY